MRTEVLTLQTARARVKVNGWHLPRSSVCAASKLIAHVVGDDDPPANGLERRQEVAGGSVRLVVLGVPPDVVADLREQESLGRMEKGNVVVAMR